MPKIYTKTGDLGETGLIGGQRVTKDAERIEAYGTVDELNAGLGVARSQIPPSEMDQLLEQIQHDLFVVGAQLATPGESPAGLPSLGPAHAGILEAAIDRYDAALPPLKQFVLPAGTPLAAQLHLARTVCRRAERRVVRLALGEAQQDVISPLIIYLNRLGDLLFVLARSANAEAGHEEVFWRQDQD